MEKREYQRITISAEGIFHLDSIASIDREFFGTIEDISEGGLKLVIHKADNPNIQTKLKAGDSFHFQLIDEFDLFGNLVEEIISGTAIVKRIIDTGDSLIFGCAFKPSSDEIRDYVLNRRTSIYMKAIVGV